MLIRIGMETLLDGQCLAWGLDFPGCYCYGKDTHEALLGFPGELIGHVGWLEMHAETRWVDISAMDLRMEQHFQDYRELVGTEYHDVHATFMDDERPPTQKEVEQALLVYTWQREELLAGLETLPEEILRRKFPGEQSSIPDIIRHIVLAERAFFQNLNLTLAPLAGSQEDLVELLRAVETETIIIMPTFVDNPVQTRTNGETWTCRKLIRTLLWHQREHINQIKKLAFSQP